MSRTPNHRAPRGWAFSFCLTWACVSLVGCDDGPGTATDSTHTGSAGSPATDSPHAGSAGSPAPAPAGPPSFVIVATEDGCASVAAPGSAIDSAASDRAFAVAWTVVDECTGAGGQHIVARDLDSDREFFLGAHACYALSTTDFATYPPPPVRFGVLRASQTAGLFIAGPCVAFPDADAEVHTDLVTRSLSVYDSEADARAALPKTP
jgi:hypothetical protein